ncbi:MAG: hypothetical protein HQK77_04850 [Desulfobacterales bacterium]|nr:hypothetical protein [Desulfobacterales bacterium]
MEDRYQSTESKDDSNVCYRKINFSNYESPAAQYGIQEYQLSLNELKIDMNALYNLNWKLGRKGAWLKKGMTDQQVDILRREWLQRSEEKGWITPHGIVGLFPCQSIENTLIIYNPIDVQKEIVRIDTDTLKGIDTCDFFSIARFFLSVDTGKIDTVGFLISTAGVFSRSAINEYKSKHDQTSAEMIQGLADRVAEDMANYLQNRLIMMANLTVETTPVTRYQPGYPGLDIKYNQLIYQILQASRIQIMLNERFEFIPESTTSALICFHPDATYG